ncbi:PTS-dependent dihydroxyacetone kinase 1, dihydroxyacetone-binding subunit DhaK isoform X2 [Halyomorpha halys]|uniref:PTS-dependent dihydroxyacetone kinase 1, dihydroxyacetone-binding subunit DhaK isoform X2 n=1 Tax=Halyomorpha halys TaxID=286706 RepID=UPI0006D52600|nr:uncharacterized protein LOC106678499 isoform X2 [Halyomorpha halys]
MERKSLLRDTKLSIKDMIEGIVEVYPGLSGSPEHGITFLNKYRGNKTAILTGGGSGHEPFPIGYIADNMLTGSVSGPIFTSPSTSHIFSAISILSKLNKGGVLVAVLNYTGDQLNFGLAIERAKAKGIDVEKISISDDVALLGTDMAAIIGNRGILGCAFIFKLLGAMSEEEKSLNDLKIVYNDISKRVASMGACLVPCRIPGCSDLLFSLKDDEVSLGCGVHGEAGISTIPMGKVEVMVGQVLNKIFESEVVRAGDRACVLIGNLGTLTQIESFIVARAAKMLIEKKDIIIERLYVGTFMSSLDMKGFQISMMNVNQRDNWVHYLDTPTSAFGWPGTLYSYMSQKPVAQSLTRIESGEEQLEGPKLTDKESNIFKTAVIAACNAIRDNKEKINELDSGCGDGDCGTTMGYFAEGVLARKDSLPWKWVGSCLMHLSKIAEDEMGGTSGAVYSLLLAGAARGVTISWQEGWTAALQTLYTHSPARVGHRTLIDALAPACETYSSCIVSGKNNWKLCLKQAVMAAKTGCHNTSTMKAKVGRAAYAAPTRLKDFDAGAFAVTVWLQAVYLSLEKP